MVWLPEYPVARENERGLLAATGHKEVVFVTYCSMQPYLGTGSMSRWVESVVNALILLGKCPPCSVSEIPLCYSR